LATIKIKIEDSGIGFDTSKIHGEFQKNNCFGLFNIKERLNYFGGEIDIDSGVGRGTKLIITAPLSSSGALT
jgi:signal transduction histidine kinase